MCDIEKDRTAVERKISRLEDLPDEEVVRHEQKVMRRTEKETPQLEECESQVGSPQNLVQDI